MTELCEWDLAQPWHGSRPLTPDCQPLVGGMGLRGLYLNVGHSFNGWREAVLSAHILGDIITGHVEPARLEGGLEWGGEGRTAVEGAAQVLEVQRLATAAFSPQRFQPWPRESSS